MPVFDKTESLAVMTHVNDDDANDCIFDDTLCEILGAPSRRVMHAAVPIPAVAAAF